MSLRRREALLGLPATEPGEGDDPRSFLEACSPGGNIFRGCAGSSRTSGQVGLCSRVTPLAAAPWFSGAKLQALVCHVTSFSEGPSSCSAPGLGTSSAPPGRTVRQEAQEAALGSGNSLRRGRSWPTPCPGGQAVVESCPLSLVSHASSSTRHHSPNPYLLLSGPTPAVLQFRPPSQGEFLQQNRSKFERPKATDCSLTFRV